MDFQEKAIRLKIYVGESDQYGGLPAYKAVVHYLRERGIWGATVTKGVYGYGKKSLLHATNPLRLSTDLPVVIDAVDSERKIQSVLPKVREIVRDGLITLDEVTVVSMISSDER
jgi:PII-like signaling protein